MAISFHRYSEERFPPEKIECPVCLESLVGKTSLRHDLPAFAEERIHPHCSDCIGRIAELRNVCSLCNREIKEIESCCPFATSLKAQSAKVIRYLRNIDNYKLFGGMFMGAAMGTIVGASIYQITPYLPIMWLSPTIGTPLGPFIYDPVTNFTNRMFDALNRCLERRAEPRAEPPV